MEDNSSYIGKVLEYLVTEFEEGKLYMNPYELFFSILKKTSGYLGAFLPLLFPKEKSRYGENFLIEDNKLYRAPRNDVEKINKAKKKAWFFFILSVIIGTLSISIPIPTLSSVLSLWMLATILLSIIYGARYVIFNLESHT